MKRYFDDPEQGPSKATSHPAFVAICKAPWFYDCGDDFAPFGNDAGNDVLAHLEDWYRGKPRKKAWSFLTALLTDWELPIDHIAETRTAIVRQLLADPAQETVLAQLDQIAIALAFGQYKITGTVDAEIHDIAVAASDRQPIVRAHAKLAYPTWEHARAKAAADKRIRAALAAMR
jgi:uncharacterized protein YfeS